MPSIVRKIISQLRYPKLILLVTSIFVGYLIFKDENNFHFHEFLFTAGYLGTFLAGIFLTHGFTVGPGVAILLINSQNQHFIAAGLIAGAGAILGNFLVHHSLKISYNNEIEELSKHRLFRWIIEQLGLITPKFVRRYILPAFAGIISATPLPDEFSAALIHASKDMSYFVFTSVAFIFNVFGIFIVLMIGRLL